MPDKTTTTMAHLRRGDVPFHFALADAFTVCDAYHCSFIGNTDPNRYYMWTGWTGNDGQGGGPVIDNDEAGYDWTTYPERLAEGRRLLEDLPGRRAPGSTRRTTGAGPTTPTSATTATTRCSTSTSTRTPQPGTPLYERARTGTNVSQSGGFFDQLREDVATGKLPQVSWVVAPEAFTEHPNWPVNYGAWYVAQVLDALTADPEVWSQDRAARSPTTRTTASSTTSCRRTRTTPLVPGRSTVPTRRTSSTTGPHGPGPYGLGPRVPMIVVSPWSTGGWVCSETFDHTSIIRFMEQRFGVREPQHHAVAPGGLRRPHLRLRLLPHAKPGRGRAAGHLRPTAAGPRPPPRLPPDAARRRDHAPPGAGHPARPARRLPPLAVQRATAAARKVRIANHGSLGAHLQARFLVPAAPPRSYTVGAGDDLDVDWPAAGPYDVTLHGPNGFFRRFSGDRSKDEVSAHVVTRSRRRARLVLEAPDTDTTLTLTDAYAPRHPRTVRLKAGKRHEVDLDTHRHHGWYDLTVTVDGSDYRRQFAGHLANGAPATSDPAIGR